MNHHKPFRRFLAMALSIVMVPGMLPVTVRAEDLPAGINGEITAFEKLKAATAKQTVAFGTPLEDLDLPKALKATLYFETAASQSEQDFESAEKEEQTSKEKVTLEMEDFPAASQEVVDLSQEERTDGGLPQEQILKEEVSEEEKATPSEADADTVDPVQEEEEQNDEELVTESEDASKEDQDVIDPVQEEPDTEYTKMIVSIPVTWTASPEYDGDTAGVYSFSAEINDFTVNAHPPVITVTVGEATDKGTITAFDELSDEIRWQNTTTAELPAELTGSVEGQDTQIQVTWEADHNYDVDSPATGLYVFTAQPGDGYTLAEDVELPRITIYIPAVKKRMMLKAGNGTLASPLEITTAAQLSEIAVLVNDGRLESFLLGDSTGTVSLKLMNDLDLSAYGEDWNSGKGWEPIGTASNSFQGIFDGNNKEITGLFINRTEDCTGLFGYLNNGTVENLKLVDVGITGGDGVGSVAGYVDGASSNVVNCSVSGSINGANAVGGLVGQDNGSSMTNCNATGSVNGINYIGGAAGVAYCNMTNCYTTGIVTGSGDNIGGVVGKFKSTMTNCYATCIVTGSGDAIGGVAGYVSSEGNMRSCYATGAVSGTRSIGGVVGMAFCNVTNCAALNPSISGSSEVGRVAGMAGSGQLSNNVAFSGMTVKLNNVDQPISDGAEDNLNGLDMNADEVKADGTIGGRFSDTSGWTSENGKLPVLQNVAGTQDATLPLYLMGESNAYFLGEGTSESPYQIDTAKQLEQLAELVNDPTTNESYGGMDICYKLTADLDLSAYGKDWNSGKGWEPIGSYENPFKGTFDGGNKNITGLSIIGRRDYYTGLFGYVAAGTVQNLGLMEVNITGFLNVGGMAGRIDGSIKNCHVSGTVNGSSKIGGVAGLVYEGSLTDCDSAGVVSGNGTSVGGIVGETGSSSITNCYSSSNVMSVGNCAGGIAGSVYSGSVTNCYSTGTVSGSEELGGIVGSVINNNVANCYSTGMVKGVGKIGGVAGTVSGANGKVENCAALNPSIISDRIEVGRISGTKDSNSVLSGNAAFFGMMVKINGVKQPYINGNDSNGADMNAASIKADGTIGGRFTDTSIWTVENGKLPVLQNIGGTQDSSFPPYLVVDTSSYFLGEGTETAPFQIGTAKELIMLAELVNDSTTNNAYGGKDIYYKLTADLDLSAYGENWNNRKGWNPIGNRNTNSFQGTFDGGNKNITGLSIINPEEYIGLFGYLNGGTVKDLGLEAVRISGGSSVGGVAGFMSSESSVTNCHVTGSVTGEGGYVGGIVGNANGKVENCFATGTVSGKSGVGGIAGTVGAGSITNCYTTGAVSGDGAVGGVAGTVGAVSITNCYSSSNVTCNISFAGGVAGSVGVGRVAYCYATGTVSGNDTVGGIVGVLGSTNGRVTNCAALNPSVSGARYVGRIAGFNDCGTLLGNVAFSGMISDGSSTGEDNLYGENISSGQMKTASFWTTADNWDASGWDTLAWTIQNGQLPVLRNVGGAQSGDGGLYLTLRDIAGATVTLNKDNYTYTGSLITPDLTITFGGETLKNDVDYQVSIADGSASNGIDAGIVTMDLIGNGNFTGKKAGVIFNIEKRNDRTPPALNYTVSESDFPKTVTITEVPGAEYQFNSGGYSQTRTFISKSAEDITLYIRLKETAEYNASTATSVTIHTANQDQSAPSAFTLTYGSVNDASYTVAIPATAGAEYSFDGTTWSGNNTKTGCQPGDSITGYKRMAAKPGYNASLSTSDSVTLPQFQVKTPMASPNGGTFTESQSVTLSCQTAGAQIYYTTDGSTPTVDSALFSTPLALSATTTVKVIAVKTGMADSDMLSVTFAKQSGGNNGGNNGGSYGGGGGSSSDSGSIIAPTSENKPNQPVTAVVPVTATANTNGTASASIPDEVVTDAIVKAQADGKAQGRIANGISIELNVTMPKGTTSLTAVLTRSSLDSLVSAGISSFKINGSLVTVSFDKKALAEIQKQSTGTINIAIVPITTISDSARKIIGTRPVYDITVGYGSGKSVSSLGGGIALVSIPYPLGENEAVGGLYAVYVDANGSANRIAGSAYDANSGCVIFTIPHFSQYGIGYTAPTDKFTDISSHWAKESIDYVVGRGLLSGVTETEFSPDSPITRSALVTALGRLAGVDTNAYMDNSFSDVNADSAYRPYIEWAYKKGIIKGIGGNRFAPDRTITREEIAAILVNYANATGYTFPVTREAVTYADASSIDSAYKDTVKVMQQAGIIMGGSGNQFHPKENATRAEVSSVLSRYIKLSINPDTAQGWAQNDTGQNVYYKAGKALTGIQVIEGVTYFFNPDGTLKTGWVKYGNNWRFYSGRTMVIGFCDLGENENNKTYYFTKDGFMVFGRWIEIDGKWYYFYDDGSLARSTKIDGYEIDKNGVRI